jgi:hypothetical protein
MLPPAPALFFDVEGLPQRLGELLGEMACGHVGALAGGVGDGDAHTAVRVRLGRGEQRQHRSGDQERAARASGGVHRTVSFSFWSPRERVTPAGA